MSTIPSPNHYTGRVSPIRVIVMHTMETAESGPIAVAVGNFFAKSATQASSHLGVDTFETVRYVDDQDTAWAAPGANADGLQLEMAGRAGQNDSDWADVASKAILNRGAAETAAWCKRWGIPARWLTDEQLADGVTRGLTTHLQVTRVFKRSTHTDPGMHFPSATFLALVRAKLVQPSPAVPIPKPKPASVVVPAFMGVTRKGSVGKAVVTFQTQLGHRGWRITADGVFGTGTDKVVRAFQSEKGLWVDGVVGPVTWRKLWTAPLK